MSTPISTIYDLYHMRDDLTADYHLVNDIDMSPIAYPNIEGWEPGTYSEGDIVTIDLGGGDFGVYYCVVSTTTEEPGVGVDWEYWWTDRYPPLTQVWGWESAIGEQFTGEFDGGGHTISNFVHHRPDAGNALLPQLSSTADVHDLRIVGVNIGSLGTNQYRAALTGRNYGTIERCSVTGVIDTAGGWYYGAIAGRQSGGVIRDCYSNVTITGDGVSNLIGGITGQVQSGTMENCYHTGSVTNDGDGTPGALTGGSNGTVTDCFYDNENSGGAAGEGTGLTEVNMKLRASYTEGGPDWDMIPIAQHDGEQETAIWYIDDGNDYPRLWYELSEAPAVDYPMPHYIYGDGR